MGRRAGEVKPGDRCPVLREVWCRSGAVNLAWRVPTAMVAATNHVRDTAFDVQRGEQVTAEHDIGPGEIRGVGRPLAQDPVADLVTSVVPGCSSRVTECVRREWPPERRV